MTRIQLFSIPVSSLLTGKVRFALVLLLTASACLFILPDKPALSASGPAPSVEAVPMPALRGDEAIATCRVNKQPHCRSLTA